MDEVIKLINSWVTSSSSGLSIDEINTLHKEKFDEPVPYQKYGFDSMTNFLKSTGQFKGVRTADGIKVIANTAKKPMQKDDVIKLIKLLVSTTLLSTDEIEKQYKEKTGEVVPFKKHGYDSLKDFLQSTRQFKGVKTPDGIKVMVKTYNESAQIDATIKLIRSFINASDDGSLSIDEINTQYRDETGEAVPFRKYGFDSMTNFLKSTGQFNGVKTEYGIKVTAKTNDKSLHVVVFRKEQNVKRKRRNKSVIRPPRGCRPQSMRSGPRLAMRSRTISTRPNLPNQIVSKPYARPEASKPRTATVTSPRSLNSVKNPEIPNRLKRPRSRSPGSSDERRNKISPTMQKEDKETNDHDAKNDENFPVWPKRARSPLHPKSTQSPEKRPPSPLSQKNSSTMHFSTPSCSIPQFAPSSRSPARSPSPLHFKNRPISYSPPRSRSPRRSRSPYECLPETKPTLQNQCNLSSSCESLQVHSKVRISEDVKPIISDQEQPQLHSEAEISATKAVKKHAKFKFSIIGDGFIHYMLSNIQTTHLSPDTSICNDSLEMQDAIKLLEQKDSWPQKHRRVIISIGTTDIRMGKPFYDIKRDFTKLFLTCQENHLKPIITTIICFDTPELKRKAELFNHFLMESFTYVLDIRTAFNFTEALISLDKKYKMQKRTNDLDQNQNNVVEDCC